MSDAHAPPEGADVSPPFVAIFEVDGDGVLVGFAGPRCDQLGLTAATVGSPLAEVGPPWTTDAVSAGLLSVLGPACRPATLLVPSHGCVLELHPVTWRGGAIGLLRADNEGRRAAALSRLADMGRWTRATVHMLNNGMLGILGYANLGRAATDEAAKSRAFNQIQRSGGMVRDRTRILMQFGRALTSAEEPTLCHVDEVLEAARKLVALRVPSAVDIRCAEAGHIPALRAPCTAVAQALAALLENALDAVGGDTGRVNVEVERSEASVTLTVVDDGEGLAEHMLARVFEPFLTTRPSEEGTLGGDGLGLTLARSTAEAFGGRVSLSSRPGEGARASITCPIVVSS